MRRRPSVGRAERPPAAGAAPPFSGQSNGSIVRPSTSPMVGVYGQVPAASGPGVGLRFVPGGGRQPDDGGALEAQILEPAHTRLFRRSSHPARRIAAAAAAQQQAQLAQQAQQQCPPLRPYTSGSLSSGGFDGLALGAGRPPPLPLPGRPSEAPPPDAGEEVPAAQQGGSMVIEGVQTGEAVALAQAGGVVFDNAKLTQQPLQRMPTQTRSRSFEQGQRDRAAIRKLEQELARLRPLCESQQKELARFRAEEGAGLGLREELRLMRQRAEEAERRLREAEERRSWHETRSRRQQEELEQLLRDERQRLVSLRGDTEDREVESRIRCRELEDRCESLSRERDELRNRMQEYEAERRQARDEALGDKLTVEAKDREIGDLRGQQRSRDAMISQLKAALAEDAATVERLRTELREVHDEQVQKEAELIERRRKTDHLQEYVLKICQPHFAVVKDDSLSPVNVSGFQVTEGYVLVPLILLLEGYALLPPQLKLIIDAKSSKLARGIDYSLKAATELTAQANSKNAAERPPCKDSLGAVLDEKSQECSGQLLRSRLGIADKPHGPAAGKLIGTAARSSSQPGGTGGWAPRQSGSNGGKDAGRAAAER